MSVRALTHSLPADIGQISGMRVARWLRESTAEQMDNYGPAAQTRVIEDAIERHGLLDTGVGWTVATSGWKRAWLTPEWQEMLAAARQGRFNLLLVAYQSRFLRNVKQTLIAIEDVLHPAGVAVFFIDERLLSSDPDQWHAIVEEATDAERYSRRMAKRQREGHAAKRRTGEPGGRPPYGFRREGKPPVLVEMPERIDLVRKVFRWSASGLTDREVAERAQLRKTHVSELLSNNFYAGVLSDGTRRDPPVVDAELWAQVQEQRSRHARRHPGPVSYRQYPLSGLVVCRACGRRITGHGGRYRHVEACPEFQAARPRGSGMAVSRATPTTRRSSRAQSESLSVGWQPTGRCSPKCRPPWPLGRSVVVLTSWPLCASPDIAARPPNACRGIETRPTGRRRWSGSTPRRRERG